VQYNSLAGISNVIFPGGRGRIDKIAKNIEFLILKEI
jgi:uridine phosphorylase